MDLEDAYRARMLAVTGMSTLIGDRWSSFDSRPRQGGFPAVTTLMIVPGERWSHEGVNPLTEPRIQIDVWGTTVEAVRAISRLIRGEMQRVDRVTAGGWVFMPPAACNIDRRSTEPLSGAEPVYRNLFDYSLFAKPEA